jgi:hypothetical protein
MSDKRGGYVCGQAAKEQTLLFEGQSKNLLSRLGRFLIAQPFDHALPARVGLDIARRLGRLDHLDAIGYYSSRNHSDNLLHGIDKVLINDFTSLESLPSELLEDRRTKRVAGQIPYPDPWYARDLSDVDFACPDSITSRA